MLRILQDGWMERVGGEKPINVDVRIIAATHRDLAVDGGRRTVPRGLVVSDCRLSDRAAAAAGTPRGHRPARARISPSGAATRFGLAPVTPTPDDLALLTSYRWPGNVRELGAVIDRAAILGDGKRLEVAKALGVGAVTHGPPPEADRTAEVPGWGGSSTAGPTGSATAPMRPTGPIEPLSVAMQRHIEAALSATRGRIEGRQGAAALLQINPHTLRAKMRKLGIDWARFRDAP